MGDLNFTAVFREISPPISSQKLSIMYFGRHLGKNLLLLKNDSSTLMIVLKNDEHSLIPEFVKGVSSRGRNIKRGIKIVGNADVILLLDEDGNLWRLTNIFEFSDEKDECLYSLEEKCYYGWIPFKIFKFVKVLEISGHNKGFVCLGLTKTCEKKLRVLPSFDSLDFEDYIFEDLNLTETSYFLTSIKLKIKEPVLTKDVISAKEAVVISARTNGRTSIFLKDGKNEIINISSIFLVNVINFEEQECLLLCYQDGKLVFIHYDNLCNCEVFLCKKLICIERCNCCASCIVWSDGNDIHHSNIKFQFEKKCFTKLIHLQVKNNIRGIVFLLKCNSGLIGVTVNWSYYFLWINKFSSAMEIHISSDKLLSEIYDAGLKISKLNREIEIKTDFLKIQQMIQEGEICKGAELRWEGNKIVIKNRITKVLFKNFWKVKFLATIKNKNYVEVRNFETDLSEGMEMKFQTDWVTNSQVKVSLIGDFGNELKLFVGLGTIGEKDEYMENKEMAKSLYEIAKKRNIF